MNNYLARSVTSLPTHLPSFQTLVYNSGQWPDYPNNFPEVIDYRKAVEDLPTEILEEIMITEKPNIYYYGMFKVEAQKILNERKHKNQSEPNKRKRI